ncbi:2,5-dioxovalerate dehydrogenase [Pseudomonas chlororaphis subsp. aurantiaca]|uniref:aldehyde dehydrogenase (NADP(+)) n=1 Tax=Pseudomonas chlororaphis TaxID=587753 RepID=UPI000F57F0C5|nr:aldehyde dehydrogenase (NADP(+)) [Pseudomonas chlororaphis]AZD20730.1 2,5-dioxovalerate dehydrogenase [Pseudomonas chlororaphis subsp. aurantiaca]AZD53293.1 2,5-dioxovalerate dehydrogenase [Pseudomonas chlororaphis subsp. aurantiaca]AZD59374.1 2,5-dioxovalerate dehydrogenase [Pseudomonas chlororaphis subsp. aurantiaca]
MPVTGQLLIGQARVRGSHGEVHALAAATGEALAPSFGGAGPNDLERACALAEAVFDRYRETSLEQRAAFLESIASNILALGDELIERCMSETGLPRARLEGERGRTVGQLRLFAAVVRDGSFLEARIDPAQPERQPLPKVDLRLRQIAIGPVAVFGASNFPLAFSVAGGDTASALAAGCPVVVKAHSAHPGTSELVGQAIQQAVHSHGLPEGVFSLLFDAGRSIGQGLVADSRIKAVGFTGSRSGGVALMQIAAAREEPIPVYAEMSSINPVLLLTNALAERGEEIAKAFVGSLTLGTGQFCTNPGLILAVDSPALRAFEAAAAAALKVAPAQTMLTPGIHASYCQGVERLLGHAEVDCLGQGGEGQCYQARAALFATSAAAFMARAELREEVFGPASLLVRCTDAAQVKALLATLEGQLTIALHLSDDDHPQARELLPLLERKAGRLLVNGFGTGVEVGHAMVHGGPFPATSDTRTTSVGSLAIQRFLRPVSYQDLPQALLPQALRSDNPWQVPQRLNGERPR